MEKKYIDGMIIKEKTITGNNGEFTVMNCSVRVDDFVASLREIESDGWANLVIKKSLKPSDKGVTHYVVPSNYKPKGDWEGREKAKEAVYGGTGVEELPF